ncbi:alanyl-tRNA editing protein [Bacillus thuringiensis]|uniref:alanyl-tRNA editing protein n=1 Tax=Bacillus thuringiensis TaxID=1428 RepID=UPI002E192E88|nr:alanyl-tRNA editing protein [Bacillus thuringiensis]
MTKLLYEENSYLRECEAQIISANENGIVLNQTIFYPGGGGQPCDLGKIQQGNETYELLKVKKVDNEIIHELDRPILHLKQGVTLQINWDRRFQNMRYHTLLHVISGYVYKQCNALATSSQIENNHARLELAFSPEIIEDIPFEELEHSLKNLLSIPHDVQTKIIDREEAEQREGVIKTVINLLPASLNKIRLVQIEDIDEQACGGTHVSNTTEIGNFSIIKIQNKGALKKRIKIQLH